MQKVLLVLAANKKAADNDYQQPFQPEKTNYSILLPTISQSIMLQSAAI